MILIDMLKGLVSKASTHAYPAKPDAAPKMHRAWLVHDVPKCINCGMCVRVCPSGAAYFGEAGKDGKKRIHFDMGRCTFCNQCVEICPVKCLSMSNNYERATTDPRDFKLE